MVVEVLGYLKMTAESKTPGADVDIVRRPYEHRTESVYES